ncbi:MAG TPA: aspartate carbamoyltransferase [Phycisphaerae bacterium]|nr:aspartate carbamoyltransferase [Phycisphaerales bacterium]HRX85442.1 aspartate carbamoyltransferase [Phycisphaerae bacterium]
MPEEARKPEERETLPTAKRVALLNRHDRIFHVILAQQFDRETIDTLCKLAEMLRNIAETRQGLQFLKTLLSHKRAMLYFIQPSTRTFLSFAAACQILGIAYDEVRNPSVSSEVKGETEDDTVRVLSQYFNLIVMRHPKEGFAEEMAHALDALNMSIPIINGGSGQDQHPTQALLDIYTLHRAFGRVAIERGNLDFSTNRFAGKTIAFVGDLKRGRTVRSLAYLLCRYPGVRMIFIAPPELQISEDILEYLGRNEVEYAFADDVGAVIHECDAIYMTRLQDEYDVAGESKKIDFDRFHISADMTPRFKPDLAIMHPLPRRKEIDRRLDTDPRAQYFSQVHNGMWMRAAAIAYAFHMDGAIIDHYQTHFTY